MRWHTVPRKLLALRNFHGELVVRNAATGSTHLLQPLAAEVFARLMETRQGLTAKELAGMLNDDEASATAAMEQLLDELKRLGLAERVD